MDRTEPIFLDKDSYKELLCHFLLFLHPLSFAKIPPPVPLTYSPGLQSRCVAPDWWCSDAGDVARGLAMTQLSTACSNA